MYVHCKVYTFGREIVLLDLFSTRDSHHADRLWKPTERKPWNAILTRTQTILGQVRFDPWCSCKLKLSMVLTAQSSNIPLLYFICIVIWLIITISALFSWTLPSAFKGSWGSVWCCCQSKSAVLCACTIYADHVISLLIWLFFNLQAAYDKILKARKAAEVRQRELSSKRRKLREGNLAEHFI